MSDFTAFGPARSRKPAKAGDREFPVCRFDLRTIDIPMITAASLWSVAGVSQLVFFASL